MSDHYNIPTRVSVQRYMDSMWVDAQAMNQCADGWMDGWMDGWIDRQMDECLDMSINEYSNLLCLSDVGSHATSTVHSECQIEHGRIVLGQLRLFNITKTHLVCVHFGDFLLYV